MELIVSPRLAVVMICLSATLMPGRPAQAQTCAEWNAELAGLVGELRSLRAEVRDVQKEYRESREAPPSKKEQWIAAEVERLTIQLEKVRHAATAAGCGPGAATSSTIAGRTTVFSLSGGGAVGSSGGMVLPVFSLTLAGDRVTIASSALSAFSFSAPAQTSVLGLPVSCVDTISVFGQGAGVGAYESASGHLDIPVALTLTHAIGPASGDLIEGLLCPLLAIPQETMSTTMTTRTAAGMPLNKHTGELVLTGTAAIGPSAAAVLFVVGGTMSPILP